MGYTPSVRSLRHEKPQAADNKGKDSLIGSPGRLWEDSRGSRRVGHRGKAWQEGLWGLQRGQEHRACNQEE